MLRRLESYLNLNITSESLCPHCARLLLGASLLAVTLTSTHAYTIQGPRYSKAPIDNPAPVTPAPVKTAPEQNPLSEQEQAALKEQEEFYQQIQFSINPDPKRENQEIKELLAKEQVPLLLYGGAQLDHFLGCINCAPKYSISIWNSKGPYGSFRGDFSLWNVLFEYGNVKSRLSPWNAFASNPPAVIDPAGKFYGFLTTNNTISIHFDNNFTKTLYMDYKDISLNPQRWFEKTFAHQLAQSSDSISLEQLEGMPRPVKKDERLLPANNRDNQLLPVQSSDYVKADPAPFNKDDPRPFKFP